MYTVKHNNVFFALLATSFAHYSYHQAFFYVHVTVHRNNFLYNKTNSCTIFQIYFD